MKYGVTGASGFLGGRVVQRLLEDGASVEVFSRRGSLLPDFGEQRPGLMVRELNGTPEWVEAISESDCDVLVHCAGCVLTEHRVEDIDRVIDGNLTLLCAVLEGLVRREAPPRLVNVGTYLEYDKSGDPHPTSLYAAAKVAAGGFIRYFQGRRAIRVVTIKPSVMYGPGDRRPRLFNLLADSVRRGTTASLSPGHQKIDFVHVEDVVDALLSAADLTMKGIEPIDETYFAVSGAPRTLREHVAHFESVAKQSLHVEWGGRSYNVSEVMDPYVDGRTLPGWRPERNLRDEILRVLATTR